MTCRNDALLQVTGTVFGNSDDAAPRIPHPTARLFVQRAKGQSLVGTLGLRPALTCGCSLGAAYRAIPAGLPLTSLGSNKL